VQNDFANQQEQLDQVSEKVDQLSALVEQAERPTSRKSFPP
jgi:hypothetical protein